MNGDKVAAATVLKNEATGRNLKTFFLHDYHILHKTTGQKGVPTESKL